MRRTARAVVCLVLAGAAAHAERQDAPRFQAGVDLVDLVVTVTTDDGRFVQGLGRDDFVVSDNGSRQPLAFFSSERVPVSLGILLDTSGSMGPAQLGLAKASINRLVADLLRPDDELFFVEFGYNAALTQEWTSDRALIQRAMRDVERPTGDTRMYDAINFALPTAQEGRHPKRAILVISDGADTRSFISSRDLRAAILDTEVLVYALGVDVSSPRLGREGIDADALRRLTDDSGGRTEVVRGFERLDDAVGRLASELGAQYHLAVAASGAAGEWRTIRVDVARRGVRVRVRGGYRR